MGNASVYLNGRILLASGAHVPALDQGLLYGLGFFETFRTSGGRPHHWRFNRDRLHAACARAGLKLPGTFLGSDESKLEHTVSELLHRIQQTDAVFRYTVTAGDGQEPTELLTHRALPAAAPARGINLRVLNLRRDNGEWIPRPKSVNCLNAMLGVRELQGRQVASSDEGVFLSREGGWVVETPRQSIAWISGDCIHVPDSSLGGVAGTCLAWMIERGEVIRPARVDLRGLSTAEAIFVCNAVRGITPVAEIWDESDSKRLGEFGSADHGRVRALQAEWQRSLNATTQGHFPHEA